MSRWQAARPEELPKGFSYQADFLTEAGEADLLRILPALKFEAYDYHGFLAKRRVVRYGVNYDINIKPQHRRETPIPEFLLGLRARVAEFLQIAPDDLLQALVSEYSPGTPIGWHRDSPEFGTIIGISLGSACRFRFKPYQEPGKIVSVALDPRSIYVMSGAARSAWQHSIPAVAQLRYSITFRTLRKK